MPSIPQMRLDNSRSDSALAYAEIGWAVFPLHTPTFCGKCSCSNLDCASPGKHPRTAEGFKDATTNTQTIKGWWDWWPDANIGIATGRVSGIVVIDVDPRNGGMESWEAIAAEIGPVSTLTALTGGGGLHLIFEVAELESLKSTGGVLRPGIDTKAEGGYIVAPPSLHVSGHRYRWQKEAI